MHRHRHSPRPPEHTPWHGKMDCFACIDTHTHPARQNTRRGTARWIALHASTQTLTPPARTHAVARQNGLLCMHRHTHSPDTPRPPEPSAAKPPPKPDRKNPAPKVRRKGPLLEIFAVASALAPPTEFFAPRANSQRIVVQSRRTPIHRPFAQVRQNARFVAKQPRNRSLSFRFEVCFSVSDRGRFGLLVTGPAVLALKTDINVQNLASRTLSNVTATTA
jgi:hypothetical protein